MSDRAATARQDWSPGSDKPRPKPAGIDAESLISSMKRVLIPGTTCYTYRATKGEAQAEAERVVKLARRRNGSMLTVAELDNIVRSAKRGALISGAASRKVGE